MKKVLILTVTAGNGHNSIAKAVQEECIKMGMEAKVVDILKELKGAKTLAWVNDKGYALACTYACSIFNKFFLHYQKADPKKFYKARVQKGPRKIYASFLKMVLEYQPDAIFCSHYIAAIMLTNLRMCYQIPAQISTFLSDYVLSPFWESGTGIDYMVIPSEKFAQPLMSRGFSSDQLLAFGLPVSSKFSVEIDKKEARRMLGIDENKFTIFVMFGGGMWSGNYRIAKDIIKHIKRNDVQIVIANGKDEKGKKKIDGLKVPKNGVQVFNWGFCKNVDVIMSASDVLVGKAGGVSVTESINKRIPLVCCDRLPQQELTNIEMLKSEGICQQFGSNKQLIEILNDLIENPEKLQEMRQNCDKIRKPDAMSRLVEVISTAKHSEYTVANIDFSKVNKNVKKTLKNYGKTHRKVAKE